MVLAAYRAHWADVIEAGKTADWRSEQLEAHTTGEVLQNVRDTYRALESQGLVAKGTVHLDPEVRSVKGDRATVYDCVNAKDFLA